MVTPLATLLPEIALNWKKMVLTDNLFRDLLRAASLAPSADNMQPWEFRRQNDTIEVFYAKSRMLATDVGAMFTWVGIGAALQNILIEAAAKSLNGVIEYNNVQQINKPVAVIRFSLDSRNDRLSKWIPLRYTNRSPYNPLPLSFETISNLSNSINGFDAHIHWTTRASDFKQMAFMDANSSYIRLEHKPLHDELFDILRFTRKEIETIRYGLTFESLEVPPFAVFFARKLQYWSFNRLVSKLGIGRLVAKQLSYKLQAAGAICLITALRRDSIAYMQAGRAMEQLWLTATADGLSVQPYGVLPQYLTKVSIEPETFLPKYVNTIEGHRKRFNSIFKEAINEFPVIVLRIGNAGKESVRNTVRLGFEQIVRN